MRRLLKHRLAPGVLMANNNIQKRHDVYLMISELVLEADVSTRINDPQDQFEVTQRSNHHVLSLVYDDWASRDTSTKSTSHHS